MMMMATNHRKWAVSSPIRPRPLHAARGAHQDAPVTTASGAPLLPLRVPGRTTETPAVLSRGTFRITGTVTLSAQGSSSAAFIVKAASCSSTASAAAWLVSGAQAVNVVWLVRIPGPPIPLRLAESQ